MEIGNLDFEINILNHMVSSINLFNFRNWEKQKFDFDQYNIISGKNASGKTNILEAIYYCAKLESFRTSNDENLLMWNKPYFELKLILDGKDAKDIRIFVEKNELNFKKKVFINGVSRLRKTLSENIKTVLFSPEQFELMFSSHGRRQYLNKYLIQKDIHYDLALKQLHKVLRSKNLLLEKIRENNASLDELYFWNLKLVEASQVITDLRREWFAFINSKINPIYEIISNTKEKISLEFYLKNPPEKLMEKISNNIQKEISSGVSLYGPHRDDWGIVLHNKNLVDSGSRGQWRSVILCMKILEAEFLIDDNVKPIILLDDFLSELDEFRKKIFFSEIKDYQIILTCAEKSNLNYLSKKWKVIKTDG